MKKLIASLLMGVAISMPTDFSEEYKEIYDTVSDCYKIEVTIDGETNSYEKESEKFLTIAKLSLEMLKNSHEMPAFSVSLDNETRQAKEKGVWLEFIFKGINTHNDMPFERLLIEVQPDWTGFNIIRYYDGKYDGRCFYIDLVDTDMSKLYDTLINL